MCGKSHLRLGEYLVEHYMQHVSGHCIRAFLIGCIQPDRNPATYFKGSVRHQWLRGHNYLNAKRFMERICHRLEHRKKLTVVDYYTLGKLIHYIADAFTQAHNSHFTECLTQHRQYERELQLYFLNYLKQEPNVRIHCAANLMETICQYHREYSRQEPHIDNDAAYALSASCSVLSFLFIQYPTEC